MMSVVKDVKKFLNKLNKMKLKNKVLLGVLILVSAIVLHYVYNRVTLLQNIVSKLRVLNPLRLMENYSSGDKFVFFLASFSKILITQQMMISEGKK